MKHLVLPAALLALSGCATVAHGIVEPVTITSNAPDATCSIMQNGEEIAAPTAVPHTFQLRRRDGNLLVTCTAPGYKTEHVALITGKDPYTAGGHAWNSMAFGLIDVISGAVNDYQDSAYVPLTEL